MGDVSGLRVPAMEAGVPSRAFPRRGRSSRWWRAVGACDGVVFAAEGAQATADPVVHGGLGLEEVVLLAERVGGFHPVAEVLVGGRVLPPLRPRPG